MSLSLTPAKRQHCQSHENSNGKKFQKSASFNSKQPRKSSSGDAIFRVLFPSSRIESVIGKENNIISQIRQETGAMVRIDDSISECDERVIFVMGSDEEAESGLNKDDNENSKSAKEQGNSEDLNVNDADKETSTNAEAEDPLSRKDSSSVRKALLLVFESFFEGERVTEDTNEESNGSATVTFRLLVLSGQVGCLLGMGGSIIKQMSAESGAHIRVLPKDKLPQCASSGDEVVQITGLADDVKKAIRTLSDQFLEKDLYDHDSFPSNSSGPASHSQRNHVTRPESCFHRPLPSHGASFGSGFCDSADFHSGVPPLLPKFHESFMPGRMDVPDFVTFQLLCPDERVGSVIGKGEAIIRTLQHETGCEIKVLEGPSDGEERLIVVSGPAHPDDRVSAVQDAVLRVQHRIAKAIPDNKEKGVTAKILVSSNQIGCLLGKGGSIIAEMRKITGAYIRILGKDQSPKNASEGEEVVEINGELEIVQEALMQIITRLQHHFFRDAFPSINHPSNFAFSDQEPPLPAFLGRREPSPPGMFPKLSPSFRSFDSIGDPPLHCGFHPHDEHQPFMHDIHRHGIPERPWHPQNLNEGGPMGLLDNGLPPQRRMSGFGGGSQQAVITNTTVDVVVPSSLVPIIHGEDGGCLRQIRQESVPDYGGDGVDYSSRFETSKIFSSYEDAVKWVREVAFQVGFFLMKASNKKTRDGRPVRYLKCDRGMSSNIEKRDLEAAIRKNTKSKACKCPFGLKIQKRRDEQGWDVIPKEGVHGTHNHPFMVYLEGHRQVSGLSPGSQKLVKQSTSAAAKPRNILAAVREQFPDDNPNIKHIYNERSKLRREAAKGRDVV